MQDTKVRRKAVSTAVRSLPWRKCLGLLCLLVLFCTAGLSLLLTHGPGPRYLAGVLTRWAEEEGLDLELEAAQIVGWGRVALHQLYLEGNGNPVAGVSVERALVTFDLSRLLAGDPPKQTVKQVSLIAPRILLGETGELTDQPRPATMDASLEALPLVETSYHRPVSHDAVQVSILYGEVLWRDGTDEVRMRIAGDAAWRESGLRIDEVALQFEADKLSGQIKGEAELQFETEAGNLGGVLRGDLTEVKLGEHSYLLDAFETWFHTEGTTLFIDSFTGEREEALLQVSGTVQSDGTFDLDVDAEQLLFERDLPFLTPYEFYGPAAFSGTFSGTSENWELEGHAKVGPGTVWGRANLSGDGHLSVRPNGMTFNGVRLAQYGGEYNLDGVWEFAASLDPGRLDLTLQARSGQAKELLELLGWQVPVAGRLYGQLRFFGPLDAIVAEGDVEMLEAVLWDQPLDRVKGTFAWGSDTLQLGEVEIALGTGTAHASGHLNLHDLGLAIQFEALDWPLGFTRLFEERLGHAIGGLIDVNHGELGGTLLAPRVTGELHAEALRLGPTFFRSVAGGLAFIEGRLHFNELRGLRAGGGTYRLSGSIDLATADPFTDLQFQVEEERLRSLLQLAGEQLPAALIDGQVSGAIHVVGTLSDPAAELDLLLKETLALKRALRVAMTYNDGALRVSELEFPPLDPA